MKGWSTVQGKLAMMMKHQGELFTIKSKNIIASLKNSDDLYTAFRSFFIFGRIIGVIPIQGVFKSGSSQCLRFRWKSPAAIYSIFLCCSLMLSAVVNSIVSFGSTGASPSDLAWSANLTIYYSIGSYTIIFFLNRAQRFIDLFKKWRELFICYDGVDRNLRRDVNIIAGFLMTSCIMEHSYAHIKFFPIVENSERRLLNRKDLLVRLQNASAWEVYYWRSHPFVGDIIPYHWTSALTVFIMSKYSILAWNSADIIIAIMSRALYYRFKILNEQAERFLIGYSGIPSRDTEKWTQLARDHDRLCDLVSDVSDLLSPLIFVLFGVNIYYFCIQLNLGLTPSSNNTIIASIYAVWSFLHLIARILTATITASHVHVHAHSVASVLKKCPIECFTPEIDRAERSVKTGKIGLSGLGCFTITRQFILHIVNVVFTFEIVLLQTSTSSSSGSRR